MAILRWHENRLTLTVRVQPKSSQEKITGLWSGEPVALKVSLMAPPVEGAANRALIRFFAKQFKVPKGAVAVIQGERSRHKRVAIENPDLKDVEDFCQKWRLSCP
ncbi:DUF167 domain-containing protein [Magnetococcales bacterium HHB-1]